MVRLIMRFISYEGEAVKDFNSYIRKYYLVEYIVWAIHRLLFIISGTVFWLYGIFHLGFLSRIIILTLLPALLIFTGTVKYLANLYIKWLHIKSYVKRGV